MYILYVWSKKVIIMTLVISLIIVTGIYFGMPSIQGERVTKRAVKPTGALELNYTLGEKTEITQMADFTWERDWWGSLNRFRRMVSGFNVGGNAWEEGEDPTYLDAIGIPRGIPDEYKARCQISAGLESIFIWVTPNKNVDFINYHHYQIQRLVNFTSQLAEGIHEQLSATSLMPFQNRLVLDSMLAEEGGACSRIKGHCCTIIPNNTAPNGKITRAMKGLQAMSVKLKSMSGVEDNPFCSLLNRMFGKWRGLILTLATTIIIVMAVLAFCGCCIIPCLRNLVLRIVLKAFVGKDPYGQYQLLSLHEDRVAMESLAPLNDTGVSSL
ncbi:uncharacterized protein LOC133484829 [Phyllopteryx taeniolatus]|uniref:uncharacterized protein LOC133484829 n=1 Tax=Phyllopteryx taeniolatus TaxID=161469 RepID=UPI002AD449A2|nr:uncharacterized protein LOC133484829 [Phyllopteryx taeniolatus]